MDTSLKKEGRLTFDELQALVKSGHVHTVLLCLVDYCGRLSGSHRFPAKGLLKEGKFPSLSIAGCNVSFNLDGNPVFNTILNSETGSGNKLCLVDVSSLSFSWLPGEAIAFYELYNTKTSQALIQCPRTFLKKIVADYATENIVVKAGSEMEFYLLERIKGGNKYDITVKDCEFLWKAHSYCDTRLSNRLEPVLKQIRDTCETVGVVVEASQVEFGPGQIEFQLLYEEVLGMCDSQIKFRDIVRTVAYNNNMHATFMSKMQNDIPGNGCHFHISLWDKNTNANIFDGEDFEVDEGIKASNTLLYFIGGLIKYLKEVFPMLAQYVNSYKRFKPMSFAPVNFETWGYDNRFATFRVVGSGPSLRVEVRIAGGDVNPYWGYGAVLACGLRGIKEKLLPPEIR
jgi:glutamine synthetase